MSKPVPPAAVSRTSAAHVPSVVARRALFDRLSVGLSGGVTLISAPAGSGKTVLLRTWIAETGLADRAAWVSVERGERDAQRFWLAVITRLRAAVGTDAFVEKLTPTPAFEGDEIIERLVSELASLEEPVVLAIDDLHELAAPDALAQLELLLDRRPRLLHLILATRRDPQLGLHRLRLRGELTEVRAADLRFTLDETRELLAASKIALSERSIRLLHARTEGWAAGLRLAALSLVGHSEPERFVAEFSGSERTIADYLLAEVLEQQPSHVRRLLLRTSVLERVNGALADFLVEGSGSERILHSLADANAFVTPIDLERAWFRYHHLLADLLRLELRRTEPDAVVPLHTAAARWYAEHGYVVDAVQHALIAQDWDYAAGLLADQAFSLALDGQEATLSALLAAFPTDKVSDPELTAVIAVDQIARGSLDEATEYLTLAEHNISAVPEQRRRRLAAALAVARMSLARRRGDFGSVLGEVDELLGPADAETLTDVALAADVKALTLMNLGIVEFWSGRDADTDEHLTRGLMLARRINRPYIEIGCLAHSAMVAGSFAVGRDRCAEAIAVAEAHGWGSEPIVGVALARMGGYEVWQGRFDEAEHWLDRAGGALRPELEPAPGLLLHLARGAVHVGRGRLDEALLAFRAAEQLQRFLVTPHVLAVQVYQALVHVQLRLGDVAGARATLAGMPEALRDRGEACAAQASLLLADGQPQAAIDALAPAVAGKVPVIRDFTLIMVLLLDAIANDQLGETQAAATDIERALALAEPDALVFPFVIIPSHELLERHPRHRTAHAALLQSIIDVLGGTPLPTRTDTPQGPFETLSDSELRVLGYLPSNLSAPEIGNELFLSLNTVKTHMRHIYAKLGVHRRTEAVERARELGLLGPGARLRR
ncbi:LuxR C-terminal-related transcriptional regulator [Nocardia terrae]|uniref:LuxR C-terminal-related transcriptional regulator n=1 Tax=Nocardia terrae TaxID=2675851 RepID=UPI0018E03299|nr:LuxR C-terminal-related transcriptional regulator [Nocardia terrae]